MSGYGGTIEVIEPQELLRASKESYSGITGALEHAHISHVSPLCAANRSPNVALKSLCRWVGPVIWGRELLSILTCILGVHVSLRGWLGKSQSEWQILSCDPLVPDEVTPCPRSADHPRYGRGQRGKLPGTMRRRRNPPKPLVCLPDIARPGYSFSPHPSTCTPSKLAAVVVWPLAVRAQYRRGARAQSKARK